ncbi:MAG: nicotinate phosphoribosyltransferase [Actinomycetota bacterium]|nr:nicotinate phosphoribosyltransferase [Actinomycetota bacterium]
MGRPDPNDPGLLDAAEVSLLCDLYELTMAASYHREGLDRPAVFELFVRHLPPHRSWLLAAGIGPTLRLVSEMRFGEAELGYLRELGFEKDFLEYLADFRFSGDVAAMPEGSLCFADEPLIRVTGPRIEAQLLETLLLNQVNFQTMVATKAARVVLAAGGGEPGQGERVIDFSPRRDHGIDAAMKVARSAAIAGCAGTSNVAAAQRYGLIPMGTMAHSYVLSFRAELEAFRAFLRAFPERGILLVDTFEITQGVRTAIEAARETGTALLGVRIDSGDLEACARRARELLDEAGTTETEIIVSGDLEEVRIAELVASGAPIDRFGVGTDLGTSRDSPVVNGVYKLVADADPKGGWRGVRKLSADKETLPGPKQVFRRFENGKLAGDVVAAEDEAVEGEPLLVPLMEGGEIVRAETMEQMRDRADASLRSLPEHLRPPEPAGSEYPVEVSAELRSSA